MFLKTYLRKDTKWAGDTLRSPSTSSLLSISTPLPSFLPTHCYTGEYTVMFNNRLVQTRVLNYYDDDDYCSRGLSESSNSPAEKSEFLHLPATCLLSGYLTEGFLHNEYFWQDSGDLRASHFLETIVPTIRTQPQK